MSRREAEPTDAEPVDAGPTGSIGEAYFALGPEGAVPSAQGGVGAADGALGLHRDCVHSALKRPFTFARRPSALDEDRFEFQAKRRFC